MRVRGVHVTDIVVGEVRTVSTFFGAVFGTTSDYYTSLIRSLKLLEQSLTKFFNEVSRKCYCSLTSQIISPNGHIIWNARC